MTDAEVICAFMESRPPANTIHVQRGADWWLWWGGEWTPIDLTLDALWKVEERLRLGSQEERRSYRNFGRSIPAAQKWHATPEQKIAALAVVLRAEIIHAAE